MLFRSLTGEFVEREGQADVHAVMREIEAARRDAAREFGRAEVLLNLSGQAKARICEPVSGDHVAVVGDNRKLLVFPLTELPEMSRGKGVRLQKYKDGGLSDVRTFTLAEGLSWKDPAGRTRTETDLTEWLGARASTGRMAPRGFPRDNRFTRD